MSDDKLKQALAKMLPDKLEYYEFEAAKLWDRELHRPAYGTELLHLCSLVALGLPKHEQSEYTMELRKIVSAQSDDRQRDIDYGTILDVHFYEATWQQRVAALAKIKNIEL